MTSIPASQARAQLYPLIDRVAAEGPIQVVGRRGTAVLVSQDEWDALVETLHIQSQPKLMAKIRASKKTKRSQLKTLDQIR
jgi:antitoxin YefM